MRSLVVSLHAGRSSSKNSPSLLICTHRPLYQVQLKQGWTHFCLQNRRNSSTRSWKHSSGGVVDLWWESPVPPPRCCIGLRPGGCGGHWTTVTSFSCSRNQFEVLCPAQKTLQCGLERMEMVINNTLAGRRRCIKQCSDGTEVPKVCQEDTPTTLQHLQPTVQFWCVIRSFALLF